MKCQYHQCALVDVQSCKLALIGCIYQKYKRGLIIDFWVAPHATFGNFERSSVTSTEKSFST